MSNNYVNDKYKPPEKTPEEKEREYCENLARKILEHELDPTKFWNLRSAQ